MCCCDDNPPSVYNHETIKKARKDHKCYECCRAISAGESYDIHSGIWEQGFDSFKWCTHCIAAQKAYEAITGDQCYCFGGLWDQVNESRGWGVRDDPRVLRLIAASRRKWRHKRGPRKGELMPVPVPLQGAENTTKQGVSR